MPASLVLLLTVLVVLGAITLLRMVIGMLFSAMIVLVVLALGAAAFSALAGRGSR